ncbi:MAG: hypothetical protein L6R39_006509 [Caloplaca ligustica]|nr:MAG: hypothetical protein L6R39_006509 [Caloplaca ligustica]
MSAPVVDLASAVQSASIKRHPSPTHDINPSTAASTKKPVSPTTSIPSDADSIPESALKPAPRRANLPPLPDMRFEQSYLASLQGAESWWRIAWITGRDQVRPMPNPQSLAESLLIQKAGHPSTSPRHAVDFALIWLAVLEPGRSVSRRKSREQSPAMVVGSQQLEDTGGDTRRGGEESGGGE